MPFTWEEISKEWLRGVEVEYTPKECVDAFNTVESTMGPGWLESRYGGQWGLAVALPIIELGQVILKIRLLPGADLLLRKLARWSKKTPRKPFITRAASIDIERNSALRQAQIALHYDSCGLPVELEPEVIVNDKKVQPDIRVLFQDIWVYCEASTLQPSDKILRTWERMHHLVQAVEERLPAGVDVKIELEREPDSIESEAIASTAVSLSTPKGCHPSKALLEGLAHIVVRKWVPDQTADSMDNAKERRPRIFVVGMKKKAGEQVQTQVEVSIPFIDERVARIMGTEARQLIKGTPGVVILDTTAIPGGIRAYKEVIKQTFSPKQNTRVSAVVLVEHGLVASTRSFKWDVEIIENPFAQNPLPSSFLAITNSLRNGPGKTEMPRSKTILGTTISLSSTPPSKPNDEQGDGK